MRTSLVTVTGVLAVSLLAGCTVKDVEPPSLAGPSTLARAITMTANKDTLLQNGVDFVDILVTSTSPTGQSQNIPLRAEIMLGGVVQDFGTLNTKTPTTPTTLRYTAPNASPIAAGQVAQVVTIAVTPVDSGDFNSEVARQVSLRLVPQGVILPTNPGLVAAFTVSPGSPQVLAIATFSAAASTNGGTACNDACSYAWNFGDGTTGAGIAVTHQFRIAGNTQVTLTVTDSRGAQATSVQTVTVAPGALPTVSFTVSPSPVGVNQDVFFSAENSTVIAPRRITRYDWSFGDGSSATGVTTTHRYKALGTYSVALAVTDDAGVTNQATQALTVSEGLPTVTATVSGLKVGGITQLNITATPATGATIASYKVLWGDGSAEQTVTSPTQTHIYTSASTFTIVVTVTDSIGRTRSITVVATVIP